MFQHTAARRRLAAKCRELKDIVGVSTHSRPKAAGIVEQWQARTVCRFNTQPPEGGWYRKLAFPVFYPLFQHTAARRRLVSWFENQIKECDVSTHSRPKAAGLMYDGYIEAGKVSTHSRPKAAGTSKGITMSFALFQHTAARRRLGSRLPEY